MIADLPAKVPKVMSNFFYNRKVGVYVRNVEIHGLVALLAALWLHETRAAALDLDLAARLLLDELYVVATTTNHLGSQVKTADWLKSYRNFLFRPLALVIVSND